MIKKILLCLLSIGYVLCSSDNSRKRRAEDPTEIEQPSKRQKIVLKGLSLRDLVLKIRLQNPTWSAEKIFKDLNSNNPKILRNRGKDSIDEIIHTLIKEGKIVSLRPKASIEDQKALEDLVLKIRTTNPGWGGEKIFEHLQENNSETLGNRKLAAVKNITWKLIKEGKVARIRHSSSSSSLSCSQSDQEAWGKIQEIENVSMEIINETALTPLAILTENGDFELIQYLVNNRADAYSDSIKKSFEKFGGKT